MTTKAEALAGVEHITHSRVVANNTFRYITEDEAEHIRLHMTDVVVTYKDGKIKLDSGGWRTNTTKERIDRFTPHDLRIWQERGEWYLGTFGADGGEVQVYYDGIILKRNRKTGRYEDVSKNAQKKANENIAHRRKLTNKINKFAKRIEKEGMQKFVPNNGNCWLCMFGKADDHDHLKQHLEENYMHGSLIVLAMKEFNFREEQIRTHFQMGFSHHAVNCVRRLYKRIYGIAGN